jgi:phosphopantetheine--protein transferase-like protein
VSAAADEHAVTRAVRPEELFSRWGADALLATLSDEERRRASRLVFEEDRRAFIAAHHLLRATLAPLLGGAAEAIEFSTGHGGRPELSGPAAGEVSFNLSHTRGLVACAVAFQTIVGVDVEVVRDLPDVAALARSTLTPAEIDELDAISPAERSRAFLRRWTIKEAYAKATGHGLGLPITSVALSAADTTTPTVLDAATGRALPGVRVTAGSHGNTHVMAIAYLPKEHTVNCGVQSHHETRMVDQ